MRMKRRLPFLAMAICTALGVAIVSWRSHAQPEPERTSQIDAQAERRSPDREEKQRRLIEERKARLRATGPDQRGLQQHAVNLAQSWEQASKKLGADVTISEPACFAKGCVIVSRHQSANGLQGVLAEFSHVKGFFQWNGGKFRGAPIRLGDGSQEVTWMFAAPPEGENVLLPESKFVGFDDQPAKPARVIR